MQCGHYLTVAEEAELKSGPFVGGSSVFPVGLHIKLPQTSRLKAVAAQLAQSGRYLIQQILAEA